MKNWETAQLLSMDLNETANGIFCANVETCILFHTHKGCQEPDKKEEAPETPVDRLS